MHLESEYFLSALHVLADRDFERTPGLAETALQAFACVMREHLVVPALGVRHTETFRTFRDTIRLIMSNYKIQELCHIRNTYLSRTRMTVSTIHAVAAPADPRESRESLCIRLLLIACLAV
jgi:hypothetical protein